MVCACCWRWNAYLSLTRFHVHWFTHRLAGGGRRPRAGSRYSKRHATTTCRILGRLLQQFTPSVLLLRPAWAHHVSLAQSCLPQRARQRSPVHCAVPGMFGRGMQSGISCFPRPFIHHAGPLLPVPQAGHCMAPAWMISVDCGACGSAKTAWEEHGQPAKQCWHKIASCCLMNAPCHAA